MYAQKVWSAEVLIESPVAIIPVLNGVKFNTDNNLKEINSSFFIVMAKDPMRVRERLLDYIKLEDTMRIIDIKVTLLDKYIGCLGIDSESEEIEGQECLQMW